MRTPLILHAVCHAVGHGCKTIPTFEGLNHKKPQTHSLIQCPISYSQELFTFRVAGLIILIPPDHGVGCFVMGLLHLCFFKFFPAY